MSSGARDLATCTAGKACAPYGKGDAGSARRLRGAAAAAPACLPPQAPQERSCRRRAAPTAGARAGARRPPPMLRKLPTPVAPIDPAGSGLARTSSAPHATRAALPAGRRPGKAGGRVARPGPVRRCAEAMRRSAATGSPRTSASKRRTSGDEARLRHDAAAFAARRTDRQASAMAESHARCDRSRVWPGLAVGAGPAGRVRAATTAARRQPVRSSPPRTAGPWAEVPAAVWPSRSGEAGYPLGTTRFRAKQAAAAAANRETRG